MGTVRSGEKWDFVGKEYSVVHLKTRFEIDGGLSPDRLGDISKKGHHRVPFILYYTNASYATPLHSNYSHYLEDITKDLNEIISLLW